MGLGMKITSGNKTRGASTAHGAQRASAKSDASFKPVSATGGHADGASSAGEASATTTLSALLSLQAGGGDGNRQNLAHSHRLLDLLEKLKQGLLSGRMARHDLKNLADAASAKTEACDPKLSAIMDEIALRARVELAKIEQSARHSAGISENETL